MKPPMILRAIFSALFAVVPLCLVPVHGRGESRPIVDVRFDGSYRQIEPSHGDEWAPTWGRNDVLYTGNNDGNSFGGVPSNKIAFGKLEGATADTLKGITVNGMREFDELPVQGPEGAWWKTLDSYAVDGTLYRLERCSTSSQESVCLLKANAENRWIRQGVLFKDTRLRALSFVSLNRSFESLLGAKPGEYVYAAAYAGTEGGEDRYYVARIPRSDVPRADASHWKFRQDTWSRWNPSLEGAGTTPNRTNLGADGANWKTTNTYSVDGTLYMFVTRCHYPSQSSDLSRRHIFQNSSIIKSLDNGLTWSRPAQENFERPMFPGKRFGAVYFVWYGKDGAARVDNADRYVYAVSNNGHFEHGDDYVLGRVLRSKLGNLSAADWTFYTHGDGMKDSSWTKDLSGARPVLVNPGKSSMTGMTYVESLDRYVMVTWRYNQLNFEEAIKAHDLSTVIEFFEAPAPWGPWKKVKSLETGELGWFAPIVGQRFQVTSNAQSVQAVLFASGFRADREGGLDYSMYKLNYMPITISTAPLKHARPDFIGGR